ncbi:Actin-related protein 8, partial [Araneus ventricosus]
VSDGKGRRVS